MSKWSSTWTCSPASLYLPASQPFSSSLNLLSYKSRSWGTVSILVVSWGRKICVNELDPIGNHLDSAPPKIFICSLENGPQLIHYGTWNEKAETSVQQFLYHQTCRLSLRVSTGCPVRKLRSLRVLEKARGRGAESPLRQEAGRLRELSASAAPELWHGPNVMWGKMPMVSATDSAQFQLIPTHPT